ncbi:MAG: NAD-dependent epimerase/dehydratase family protein [Aggregatilineales bacterium]
MTNHSTQINNPPSTVFVTGGTGFLGHSLLPLLVKQGWQVRALVRHPDQHPWLRALPVEVIPGDVGDVAQLAQGIAGCQYVIHAAGRFRFWGASEQFDQVNVQGTANVVSAAVRAGVEKFVHISTLAVIGTPQPGCDIDESHPTNPGDPYQRSKLRGETVALDAYRNDGLPVVILRPGAFYGPNGRYAFNRLFFEDPLMKGLRIKVDGGRHITFPVYIEDVAISALLALERGTPGELYNICGDRLNHNQIDAIVSELAGISPYRFGVPSWSMLALAWAWTKLSALTRVEPYYPLNLRYYVFNDWPIRIDKACRELGFAPTPFREGAKRTLDWYEQSGLWRRKDRSRH